MTNSIATILANATKLFAAVSDTPRLDAEVLLAFVLNKDRSYLRAWPEQQLTKEQQHAYIQLQTKRSEGIPIAYLVGEKEFWSLPLFVSAHTLIPRPATESLVEAALQLFPQQQLRVLDLGTGTGAIALALASSKPEWEVIAVDISQPAIEIAKRNAKRLGCENVQFIVSDWFSGLAAQHQFDLIVSNPPYIAKHDQHLLHGEVRFEPKLALVADEDGFASLRTIITHAKHFLTTYGCLMLEHGYDQAIKTRKLLQKMYYTNINTICDHEQHERVTIAFS